MIDFQLTKEQTKLQHTAKSFAEREIKPRAMALDRIPDPREAFPWDIYVAGNKLGFNKITIPATHMGLGLGELEACLAIEELSVADGGIGTTYFVHNALVYWILGAGSAEQAARHLTACATDPSERYFISVGDTEHGRAGESGSPRDHAPGPAMTMRDFAHTAILPPAQRRERMTVARRNGDGWVINGGKRFITTAGQNALYIISATTDPERPDAEATALFLVPADTPGVSIGRIEDKMGQRLAQNAEVLLKNVRVPECSRMPGGLGGAVQRGNSLNTFCAAVFVGIARRAFEESVAYAKERYKGGGKIVFHQAVQRMLVDMVIGIKTARLMTWLAAWEGDNGCPAAGAGIAKVYATEMAVNATNQAMQVFGGYGYMRDFVMEKLVRDARLGPIYDASNEMIRHGQILPAYAIRGTA